MTCIGCGVHDRLTKDPIKDPVSAKGKDWNVSTLFTDGPFVPSRLPQLPRTQNRYDWGSIDFEV